MKNKYRDLMMDKMRRDLENANDLKNRELEDIAQKLRRLEHDVREQKSLS
jgi:hypothetical protein